MAQALQLAKRGLYSTKPNPRVGCVLARNGEMLGQGWHVTAGEAHAEIIALRNAGNARDATAYVTLEPCAHQGRTGPCVDALIAAGVTRVVAAVRDPNPRVAGKGFLRLGQAGVVTQSGLMDAAARALNPGHFKRCETGLPWVRCKLAMSLDGRTAMASGESRWITGPSARRDVQRWRARSGAVLTGIGTVLADDPQLGLRPGEFGLPELESSPQPVRVVLDSDLRMPAGRRMFDGAPVWVFTRLGSEKNHLPFGGSVTIVPIACTDNGLDLEVVLRELGRREISEVLVEAGATLAGAMLREGLIDELVLYVAPKLLGDLARPLFKLHLNEMGAALAMDLVDQRSFGQDLRFIFRPRRSEDTGCLPELFRL